MTTEAPEKSSTPVPRRRTPPPFRNPQSDDLIDLSFLHLLWQRRWLIVFGVLFFAVLGAFQVKRSTPIYTSEAVLKYEPAAGQAVDFGERSRIIYSRDELRTSAQLIRTPAIATEVLAAIDDGAIAEPVVDDSPLTKLRHAIFGGARRVRSLIVSFDPPKVDQERLAAQSAARSLLNQVSVSLRPDTKLIEVRVHMSDAAMAERVCDEFCRQFIRRLRDERRETFTYARQFLSQQIDTVRAELERAEYGLFEYGGQADMSLLESDRELAISTLSRLNGDIEVLRNEIALLQAEADPAIADANARQLLATERQGTIGSLRQRRDELLLREAELRAENNEDFLPLQRVRRELSAIEEQIKTSSDEFAEAYVATRQSTLDTATRRLGALQSRLREHQERVNSIEQRMIRFRILQRDIESTREIYNALLDRFKRLEATDEAPIGTVTIESPASIPTVPSSPNVTRILASFAGFGFFLSCGLVLLLQKLDRSVKDPGVVEQALGIPALAHIPFLRNRASDGGLFRKGTTGERVLAPFDSTRSHAGAEAFRYLRTSINYSTADIRCQVLLVTSCLLSEGKSTVAANLGVFFAEQGKKVLLIDGDLKKPSVHKTFAIPRLPGLSDVLTGQAEFSEIVNKSVFEGFDILPAGLTTPSPATLLESNSMSQFVDRMRKQYDVVIIDSSPAHGMADALVLAKISDGVLLAVRYGSTPMDVLARVTEKLLGMGVRILGAVYNSTDPGPLGAQYGKYYGKYTYGTDARK